MGRISAKLKKPARKVLPSRKRDQVARKKTTGRKRRM
jgi:hypothetical protein